ncbi:MAG: hypothetical protein ACK5JT_11685, partial [Hyphomicrobiaceae bacterium]
MNGKLIATMAGIALLGACSTGQQLSLPTASIPQAASSEPTRGTPVVSGRPARLYILAGFKEADCSAVTPIITVTKQPRLGQVTLKPGQSTSIEHSVSGKCTGQKMLGTGIYYTAAQGKTGAVSFEI